MNTNAPALSAPASAPRLDEIIEWLPQGVVVFGPDRRVALVNRAYRRLTEGLTTLPGDSLEEVLRHRIAQGEYGPGDPEVLLARHLAYDPSRPQTRRRRRPNGTILENRWVPLADGAFMIVCTDITSLVGAEQALVRRGAETDILLGGLRHGLILWGPDRRLLLANPMAATLLGLPPEMLTPGRPFVELVDAMLAGGFLGSGQLAQAIAAEIKAREWSRPWVRHFVNAAGRFIERRSDPVAGGMNITTLSDITEQREAEHALRRAKEAAEAASQAKSRFLATMSHELRTPLNAVIGYSESLAREAAAGSESIAEYAGAINEAGRRLLGLIDTLLDVARLETGRFDLTEETVDVARLVQLTLRQFALAAKADNIALATALPADPHPGLPSVLADRRRLGQVLYQLLSNALKFSRPGGTVTVGAGRDGEGMLLWVADTGIGIAEADLARVFDPFTQVDTGLARRFPGAGLGLYLARALVESHGGVLSLTSRKGEGTTAEIRLPPHRLLPPERANERQRAEANGAAEPAIAPPGLAPAGAEPTLWAPSRPEPGAAVPAVTGAHTHPAAATELSPLQEQESP